MMDNAAFIEGWYKCNWPVPSINGFSGFFTGHYYYFHDGRTTTKVKGRWPEEKTWPPEQFSALTENSELAKDLLAWYCLERVEFPFKGGDVVYVRWHGKLGTINMYDESTGRYNVEINREPGVWFRHWYYPWELSYPEKQKEEEKHMGDLLNGWYKCTESNEQFHDGSWSWIEGRYYYFKNGRTTDERGVQRPREALGTSLWLKYCFLIPAAWSNGRTVKLKDGRTGKITICKDEMIEVQLDSAYDIPSFVQVTPNDFEMITPETQALKKMTERLKNLNESMKNFRGFIMNLQTFKPFEIPEVGQLVRDKDDLSVWRVEEVTINHLCCDSELRNYTALRRMDIVHNLWTSNLMRHETRFYNFWDHYEKWSDDMGFTGMFFDMNGRVRTVCNGFISGHCINDGSCRYKDLDEIRKYVDSNAIEVDTTTYCKQEDPAKDWFTGYAICVNDGRNDPKYPWVNPITVGKIYRMEKGRFSDDNNYLNNCTPEEFKMCFKPVNESFE